MINLEAGKRTQVVRSGRESLRAGADRGPGRARWIERARAPLLSTAQCHGSSYPPSTFAEEECSAEDYWVARTVAAPAPGPPAADLSFFAGSRPASAVVPASEWP